MKWLYLFLSLVIAFLAFPTIGFAQEAGSAMQDMDPSLTNNINFENWELLVGFLTPIILEFLLQSKWTSRTKALMTFGFALVVTLFGQMLQDTLTITDWAGSTMKVLVVTFPVYYGLVKHLGIKAKTDL